MQSYLIDQKNEKQLSNLWILPKISPQNQTKPRNIFSPPHPKFPQMRRRLKIKGNLAFKRPRKRIIWGENLLFAGNYVPDVSINLAKVGSPERKTYVWAKRGVGGDRMKGRKKIPLLTKRLDFSYLVGAERQWLHLQLAQQHVFPLSIYLSVCLPLSTLN